MTQQAITLQAEGWFKIDPNDRYNFVGDTERNPKGYAHAAIYVGTGGDLVLVSKCGEREVFKNVPDGTFFPADCVRVHATGTTASNILGVIQSTELPVKIR